MDKIEDEYKVAFVKSRSADNFPFVKIIAIILGFFWFIICFFIFMDYILWSL